MDFEVSINSDIVNANSPKSEQLKNIETDVPKVNEIASPRRSESGSPEPNCAICLGKLENKSFTDSCFHQFCFTCLSEWSKVKAECPLCKQAFKSIIHNVRSIEDYDQYYIANKTTESGCFSNTSVLEMRRFRYPSTMTAERRRHLALERSLEYYSHRLSSYANHLGVRPRVSLYRLNETSEFRRHIYESRLWVRPLVEGRYRETSPEFYRENPACTHRLIPWLNRELVALLTNNENQATFVMELIMALIVRYEITSAEFYEHVFPYFQDRTPHFIHEFYNYCRSSASDLTTYDRRAVYEPVESPESSNNSSPNSIIEVPIEGERTELNPVNTFRPGALRMRPTKRRWRALRPRGSRSSPSRPTTSVTSNSTPLADFIPLAGPSNDKSNNPGPSNVKTPESNSDSDCVILECISVHTPEVVDLTSDPDDSPPGYSQTEAQTPNLSSSRPSRLVRKNRCTYFFDYSSEDSDWNDRNSDTSSRKVKIRSVIGSVKNLPPISEKHSSSSRKKHKKHKKHKSKPKSSKRDH